MIDEDDAQCWSDKVVGALLDTPPRAIQRGIREGRDLPPSFRVGRKILFRKTSVLRWLEEQELKGANNDGGDPT